MYPTPEQGLGILLACGGLALLLAAAGKFGFRVLNLFGLSFQRPREKSPQELEWDREDARYGAALERRQAQVAFQRYAEAAVGMVPMVGATGPAHETLTAWFDVVADAIAASLVKQPEDHYRVGIYADLGDPDAFSLLGCCRLDRNNPRIERLSKEGTLAGHAFTSKAGEYLCADIKKDRRYKNRSGKPRPYQSVFAIRVGDTHAWGVMTIDAPRANGFSTADVVIIRRFAKLISAGAAIAVAKYSPGALPIKSEAAKRIAARPELPAQSALAKESPSDD